jgi:hypothetical protein
MKKLIVVSVIISLTLFMWGFFASAQSQDIADEEKPTFYRLIPGTYVNGWPRFTINYPKDWVERRPDVGGLFRATPSGSAPWEEGFTVFTLAIPMPLDKYVDFLVPYFKAYATDVTVVSDKPSRLRDGSPAREIEIQMVRNAVKRNWLGVATLMGGILISANVATHKVTIGEDLRAIPYSLEFEQGKDEPVKVPPDVQDFFDRFGNDILSHDVVKVMSHYSDRFLNSGIRKGETERNWRQNIGSITSQKGTTTDFVPAGDRAYLTGFVIFNNTATMPNNSTSIIKESGEWKWYGNQRDVSP